MNVTKVIGLEGFANSGKSSTLRELIEDLVKNGWKIDRVFENVYGHDAERKTIYKERDCIVVLKKDGQVIVVVLMGDYENVVNRIRELLGKLGVNVDLLFVAMRYPEVGEAYRGTFKSKLTVVFKPGYKRWDELPNQDGLVREWVERLKDVAGIDVAQKN